jgi:hypothetical protein
VPKVAGPITPAAVATVIREKAALRLAAAHRVVLGHLLREEFTGGACPTPVPAGSRRPALSPGSATPEPLMEWRRVIEAAPARNAVPVDSTRVRPVVELVL